LVSSNSTINLSLNTGVLSKTNFTFNGWNTQADGLMQTHQLMLHPCLRS
jgi:hypothetical protein